MNQTETKRIQTAITSFQSGKPIIVTDANDRENEADVIYPAETIKEQDIAFMLQHTSGIICVPCEKNILKKLKIPLMVENNTARHGCAFTVSIDAKETKTGVSAAERAQTIQALCDPKTKPEDFTRPGHIFPLQAKESILERQGHTEAAVELCKLAKRKPIAVLAELMNPDGSMMREEQLQTFARKYNFPIISIEELVAYIQENQGTQKREENKSDINQEEKEEENKEKRATHSLIRHNAIHLPSEYGDFTAIPFEEEKTGITHLAILKGDPTNKQNILTRIHSECLTGDILGSQRCDCGDQLKAAMLRIEKEGLGIILYMRQEGRGIGLLPKLQAYHLQEKGFDTIEANELLGFKPDEREYTSAVEILKNLNITTIKLLTNNPEKIQALNKSGIHVVDRISLEIEPTMHNKEYLTTKKEKMGHLLNNV
ncbi:GTP cyclohydrolase II [Candidatus Woesearchaeota archaeon]|nr:GTP cyclohydrolase II [Candidatus Woesearchaeota archaeon]